MKVILYFFVSLLLFIVDQLGAQDVIFGTKDYVELRKGNINIMLSVPHDGIKIKVNAFICKGDNIL